MPYKLGLGVAGSSPFLGVHRQGGGMPYTAKMIETNPIIYFPLNEADGLTAINYGTLGTAANGTYSGATLAQASAPGGGLAPSFDGVNDKVDIFTAALGAQANNIKATGTISVWVKPSDANVWLAADLNQRFMFYFVFVNTGENIRMRKEGAAASVYATYEGSGDTNNATASTAGLTVSWYMFTATFHKANDQLIIYRNGVQQGPTKTGLAALPFGALTVATVGDVWKGNLAHAAIWNRVLTADEILVLYNGGL